MNSHHPLFSQLSDDTSLGTDNNSFIVSDGSTHHNYKNCDIGTSTTLLASLRSYKYLDDYEYCRKRGLERNAMRKFGNIMQSIKSTHKDSSKSALKHTNGSINSNSNTLVDNDNDIDSDLGEDIEDPIEEFSNFNRILKRHRKRFKPNISHSDNINNNNNNSSSRHHR